MCKHCRTKPTVRYEGKRQILEPNPCNCQDCNTTEFADLPRCVHCGHWINIIVVGVNDQEGFDDIWVDKTGHPVKL